MSENDISLAIRLENLTLLESIFHTSALPSESAQTQLQIINPENRFDVDVKAHRTVLRATVGVRYAIVEEDDAAQAAQSPENDVPTPLLYNQLMGVVVSVPFMGDTAVSPGRHMAGAEDDTTVYRDKRMEQNMRIEAIKAAYAYATSKLAEQSAMSPLGQIVLPLIDADEILDDIMHADAQEA